MLFQAHVNNKIPEEETEVMGAFNKAISDFTRLLDDVDVIKNKQVSQGGVVHMKAVTDIMKLAMNGDADSIDQRACESHCEQIKLHGACLSEDEPARQYYIKVAEYVTALIPVCALLHLIA